MSTDVVREKPSLAGVYPIADVTALIQATRPEKQSVELVEHRSALDRINSQHLYRWVKDGLAGNYLVGLRGKQVALTFLDLVSMRLISVFRAYGVSSAEIRAVHQEVQETRGWTHPFAMEPLWVSRLRMLVVREEKKLPINLARNEKWRAALIFRDYFMGPHRLAFNGDLQAEAWEPEQGIVLDPKISFGEPCLSGTRIATQTLWALHAAGDTVERIADAYELPVEKIEAALAWERRLGYNGAG